MVTCLCTAAQVLAWILGTLDVEATTPYADMVVTSQDETSTTSITQGKIPIGQQIKLYKHQQSIYIKYMYH